MNMGNSTFFTNSWNSSTGSTYKRLFPKSLVLCRVRCCLSMVRSFSWFSFARDCIVTETLWRLVISPSKDVTLASILDGGIRCEQVEPVCQVTSTKSKQSTNNNICMSEKLEFVFECKRINAKKNTRFILPKSYAPSKA